MISQIWVLLGAGIGTAYLLDTWVGHEFPTLTVSAWLVMFLNLCQAHMTCEARGWLAVILGC